jgi:REP element-mobilizing transposase RayT
MVHGYHVIIVTYGTWLPNDPRGSWSDFVASWELFKYGAATRGENRQSLIDNPQVAHAREVIQQGLKYPPVQLTGQQAREVAQGFAEAARKSRLTVWACSILPEHVHLVLARGRLSVERMANLFKGEATKQLNRQGLHPLARFARDKDKPRSPWARKQWQVFLDSEDAIENAVRYTWDNPTKEGKQPQTWSFVRPFTRLDTGVTAYWD